MAENDFVVNFGTDDFQVIFGEQGPQGPASAATPFVLTDTYEQGDIVFDTSGNLFGSRINDNTGNPLTDTDSWVALGIASGVVTQLDDLTDVTVDTPLTNQGLIYDGTVWVNKAIPSNIPINPTQEKTTVTLDPTEVILNNADQNSAAVMVAINDGFSIDGIEVDVRDQNNHPLTATPNGTNRFIFNLDNSIRGTISVTVHVSYTRDSDLSNGTDTIVKTLPVREPYYESQASNTPGQISNMTQVSVWNSPQTNTFTTLGTGQELYFALPIDREPYRFTSGIAILDQEDLGTISNIYTLFRLPDYDDSPAGRTFTVTIEEA